MKKNIKEELETKYLKEDLVNDNTLLLYEQVEENRIAVKMRFIEFDRLKEKHITNLTPEEFAAGDRIQLNEDKTALAVFKKYKGREILYNFFDLETHYAASPDYMDFAYNTKFKNKVDNYLKLVR